MNEKYIVLKDSEDFNEYANVINSRFLEYSDEIEAQVLRCYSECSNNCLETIVKLTKKYDSFNFDPRKINIGVDVVDSWVLELDDEFISAVHECEKNIIAYNVKLMESVAAWNSEIHKGHFVGGKYTPVETAFLWVPSKKGPLISTALMLVCSAKVAGVKNIIVATPPSEDGVPNKMTMAASRICGATHFVVGNGVSLIASAAMGLLSIPKPDIIFGPGPSIIGLTMIHAMKYGVKSQPGIGPSDSLIFAPQTNISEYEALCLARDILNELEHGVDSFSYLLVTSLGVADAVEKQLKQLLADDLPRGNVLLENFRKLQGGIIVFESCERAIEFINEFAPEHLMIFEEAELATQYSYSVYNAGEIIVGKNTTFSAANYCVGITGVLPTNAYARSFGGIVSTSFLKYTCTASLSKSRLNELSKAIEVIGSREGLPNHVLSVKSRLLNNNSR